MDVKGDDRFVEAQTRSWCNSGSYDSGSPAAPQSQDHAN